MHHTSHRRHFRQLLTYKQYLEGAAQQGSALGRNRRFQNLGLEGAKRRRVYGGGAWERGVWGAAFLEECFILGSQNACFGAFSGPSECLLQHCNSHLLHLPSPTFQADCGSVKGAGVLAEHGTEHYLLW